MTDRKRTNSARKLPRTAEALLVAAAFASPVGCSTLKSVFTPGSASASDAQKPIRNPFGQYDSATAPKQDDSMIFRSKRQDGSVEVELPRSARGVTDFVLPGSTEMTEQAREQAAVESGQSTKSNKNYADLAPTLADREITHGFSQGDAGENGKRGQIERGLGLMEAEEAAPERNKSYLGAVNHIKQLYRGHRFEAALIETDAMIRDYPTDPKLHEMRGTLLDRMGHEDLAIRSWNQALRFNPKDEPLRRFVEKRESSQTNFTAERKPAAVAPTIPEPAPTTETAPAHAPVEPAEGDEQ